MFCMHTNILVKTVFRVKLGHGLIIRGPWHSIVIVAFLHVSERELGHLALHGYNFGTVVEPRSLVPSLINILGFGLRDRIPRSTR